MTKYEQSFITNRRRKWGRLLLILLSCLMIVGSAGFGLGLGFQNSTFFSLAWGLTFSYLAVTAICLGLMDFHPFKRIILFVIVPTMLFAVFALAGLGIAVLNQNSLRFMFGSVQRLGIDIPFFCISVAWLFWFYRCYRGWLITRRPTSKNIKNGITFPSAPSVPLATEIFWLLFCLGLVALLCLFNQVFDRGNQEFLLFPVGGLIALLLLLPVTYLVMRTQHPIMVWSGLCIGVPILTFLVTMLVLYSQLDQPSFLTTDEIKAFLLTLLLACTIPVSFLMALRMVGYRLEVSKPWQEKIEPVHPKPHPLDD